MLEQSALKVRVICHDLGRGGAARATTRLIEALSPRQDELGLELSVRTAGGPPHALALNQGLPRGAARQLRRASHFFRHRLDRLPSSTTNEGLHSRADVWTGIGHETNRAPLDIVNIHWVGTGTMSIGEIGRLRHPVVMTLHDMWAFCGSEHYSDGVRYRSGYSRDSRPSTDNGIDWNRLTWLRKRRKWRTPMNIITPSNWLANCVRSSALMAEWTTTVIPNALDTEAWVPVERRAARAKLGLPTDATLILFGADGGTAHSIKGGDLLEAALQRLPLHLSDSAQEHKDVRLVIFGGEGPRTEPTGRLPFPVIHLGRADTDERLRAAYSACEVMVVPSRLDNLPSTATEAQACATPVVAFSVGGLTDIVDDYSTGRLCEPFEVDDLARAIAWVTEDATRNAALGSNGRNVAATRFKPSVIASAYADVYRNSAQSRQV